MFVAFYRVDQLCQEFFGDFDKNEIYKTCQKCAENRVTNFSKKKILSAEKYARTLTLFRLLNVSLSFICPLH